ncbi:hypothetical protein [Streptomyces sp. NPDC057336]|uniref:hypothetical protein n=1 Tax=Streptomyces sp. NPDC057336 TaxID=3346102 RepID=UPI003637200D
MTDGYHDNAAANAEAFTDDGWFDTGDLAFLRDGELRITGRAEDVIIVKHYCHEIEACIEEPPAVVRSYTAVCSAPAATIDQLVPLLPPGTRPRPHHRPAGRTCFLGRSEPAPGVPRLSNTDQVRYARADVTDKSRVRAAVDAAGEAWGVPLVSVWHQAPASPPSSRMKE